MVFYLPKRDICVSSIDGHYPNLSPILTIVAPPQANEYPIFSWITLIPLLTILPLLTWQCSLQFIFIVLLPLKL